MTELASSLGCQYDHCVDYDSMDGTPEGLLRPGGTRAPGRAEHQRLGPVDNDARAVHAKAAEPAGRTNQIKNPDQLNDHPSEESRITVSAGEMAFARSRRRREAAHAQRVTMSTTVTMIAVTAGIQENTAGSLDE